MILKTLLTTVILTGAFAGSLAIAAGKSIAYTHEKTTMEGYMAEAPGKGKNLPAYIIVHDWMGLSDDNKKEADQLAAQGAIAFAVDMYGKDQKPKNVQEAGQFSGQLKDNRTLLKARIKAAYDKLLENKRVDPTKIVVFGYCFGGTTALELARAGVSLAGTVSYHGSLNSANKDEAKKIKGKVLVLHGAIDPWVLDAEVNAFQKEMDEAKIDYQVIKYSGAVHAFTNKNAGSDIKTGAAYDPVADARSRKHFAMFVDEVLKKQK